ncbi:MAG: 2-oxoacid:acceptor oxidoreductase family protein [Desulfobacterota bacterium]|nr:2-oxoacid:acceptor oxidoreductase family protein [Thermodesulfobacteriota bacterium]
MIEIKFKGRGGQGVVVASEILGKALFEEGKYPQCFSLFGSERRGAPVFGFLRVDQKPILLKCQIRRPDHLVIFDQSLLDEAEVLQELKPGGTLLVNTEREIDAFERLRQYHIGLIDVGPIARKAGIGAVWNTAILGAYASLTHLVKKETLIEVIRKTISTKIESNLEAFEEAYDKVKTYERVC